jgi:hypothetical protein
MLQWYEWHTARQRLQARLHALTRGRPYRFQFDLQNPTGYTDLERRIVGVNPIAFDKVFEAEKLPVGPKRDEANFQMSRALTGHEALHAVYTDAASFLGTVHDPDLKDVTNILEDARIENIGAQESHVSKVLFKLLSAVCQKMAPPFEDKNLDNPYSGLQLLMIWREGFAIPDDLTDEARDKWIQIRNWAEEALYAPHTSDVVILARKICDFLELKNEREKQNKLRDQMRDLLAKTGSVIKGKGKGRPKPNPLDNPNGQGGQGTDDGQGGDDDVSDAGDGGDDDTVSNDGDQDGDDAAADTTGDRDDKPVFDMNDLIQDARNATREDLKDVVPKITQQMMRGASQSGGNPAIIGCAYDAIYQAATPIADELVRELRGEDPKASNGASMYPGKFRPRYWLRDPAMPYAKKVNHGMHIPKMALSVVLDRSVSMSGMIEDLRIMTMALYLACEQLKIPLAIWVLEGAVHLKGHDEWGPHVMAKIAGIEANTYTQMMPTVSRATDELKARREDLKQMVWIHDGGPGDHAEVMNWRWKNGLPKSIGLYCMYIVPKGYRGAGQDLERRNQSMDELVGPQCYCMAYINEVAKFWCSYMKNKRTSFATRT